jgi:tocopherol O-methyltransferase
MIACPTVTRSDIRTHYNLATLFYRLLWGRHVHHGLWDADESPEVAQERLIERMVADAEIRTGSAVLDVGCGIGGSSIFLARQLGCQVTGLTVSGVQRRWAARGAWWHGVRRQARFLKQDAETAEFPPRSFDVIWSIECTEHFFDKPRFFRRAAGWLKPGGRMAICAWLAGDEPQTAEAAQQVYDVCEGFLCPSLGTAADYRKWLTDAGLEMRSYANLTPQVMRTWEICSERARRSRVGLLARLVGVSMTRFLDRFATILNAYRSGAMNYGLFVAQAPP